MARAGIEEEMEHAVLCGRVLAALGEEAVAEMPELPQVERHEDASPIEAVLRDAISIGACSETVAVAPVGAEREQAGSGGAAAVLIGSLKDRSGTRGWGGSCWMSRCRGPVRGAAEIIVGVSGGGVRAPDRASFAVRGLAGDERSGWYWAPDGPASFRVFVETMTGVTVPGLAQRGLSAETAWGLALEGVQARAREERRREGCIAAEEARRGRAALAGGS
ncbi:MAG: hypothetical protein R3F14_32350 [Polyangiaceae bacterium]